MKTKVILRLSVLISIASFLFFFSCEKYETNEDQTEDVELTNIKKAATASRHTALYFDGVDNYVAIPDDPSLDLTNGFTIAAWIYLESYIEWASVVTKGGSPSDDNNYTLHQTGPAGGSNFGKLRFTGSSPALPLYLESNTLIPLNEWHHVAMVYDGTTLIFYLDGQPDGGGLLPGPLVPNDNLLFIGADFPGGDEFWHGAIDEVKIWDIALSPKHIRVTMRAPSTPMGKFLAGYWKFNEGEGNVVYDKSENMNDGSLINNPQWIYP